jgi:hypothetical protein
VQRGVHLAFGPAGHRSGRIRAWHKLPLAVSPCTGMSLLLMRVCSQSLSMAAIASIRSIRQFSGTGSLGPSAAGTGPQAFCRAFMQAAALQLLAHLPSNGASIEGACLALGQSCSGRGCRELEMLRVCCLGFAPCDCSEISLSACADRAGSRWWGCGRNSRLRVPYNPQGSPICMQLQSL